MGAAASLTEEQQLVVYNKMKTYLESKDVDDMPDAQRQLYEELRLKYKHFASDVKRVPKSSKDTRQSYFLNLNQSTAPEHQGLLVGDIVRVRDSHDASTRGMWFEGLLVGVDLQANAYTVELEDSQVSVPLADIQRVRPWHFVEPGDAVECRPDGQAMWFAGSVTACNEDNDTYTVLMDGDESPETLKGDQIRKVHSVRSRAARRWRRAMMVLAGVRRMNSHSTLNKMATRESWDSSCDLDITT
eukprot:TRINITY_DN29170_c0_g1_i1.p1 TRINITY_DN29170_c0_g1~~TRINITY_DN29170_c0_g1_i1.p1  ORF type:complete len:244 (+),score=50.89 TRINITY_DN29170_c0_g1_i1:355-1086(+)